MGIKKMSEGRKTQIVLLDERRLEILIQPRLYAGELLDLVASHFNLKEKEYFGLSFRDDTGHHHWLQLDRKVLEHDFPKKSGPLTVYFAVRFFIESIAYLRDTATIELFYLQAKQSIFKGLIECDSETSFELAAHVLQATYGNFTEEEVAKSQLKKLPVLPTSALKEHPSITYCEEEVVNYYKKLAGQSRGSAIVNYMTIAESLPTYGIHYYEVKDKSSIPWWLGLSYKGIAQYDYNDKKTPRRVFAWKQLENLYFRDKKFSIEVHDPKRVSVSRRTFGPGNVNVHAWFASTPALTKCIWSMAVSQHQFYLDRKQSKYGMKTQLPSVRSMSEIAADLGQSTSSLPSSASGSISRSNSLHSLTLSLSTNITKLDFSPEELEANRAAQRDMYAALKARKDALEDALRQKTEELKSLCLKESELTGELPPEFPLVAGEIVPQVRRRVGTAFALSPNIINRDKASQVGQTTEEEQLLARMEMEFEIQDKIAKAAARLAQDVTVAKSVRKQRQQTYCKAHQKLKGLEMRLNEARRNCGRAPVKVQSSMEDMSEDSAGPVDSEPEFSSPSSSPAVHRRAAMREQYPQVEVVELEHPGSPSLGRPLTPSSQGSVPRSASPASPSRQGAPGVSRGSTPSPNPPRQYTGGYTPSSVYQTRTQYRVQNYPTFTTRSQSSSSTQSEYDNVNGLPGSNRHMTPPHLQRYENSPREAVHNMYNVSTHQTVHYNSTDELGKSSSTDDLYNDIEASEHFSRIQLPSKHGSLEGAYRRRSQSGDGRHLHRYASQDHNLGQPHFIIPNLVPSRFGSKRESTADYRESMYPPDEYTVYNMPDVDEVSHSGSSIREEYLGELPPPPTPHDLRNLGDYSQLDDSVRDQSVQEDSNGLPYMDSSTPGQSMMAPPTGGQWYPPDSGPLPQQPPPHTPHTEVPPQSFSPDSYDTDAMSPSGETQPHLMTVTKYQSYVEVSKPFEMSDFYKYSEKLRRQRNIQSRQQKLEAVLSGQPLPKSASQESNMSSTGPPPVPVRYNSYISSPNAGSPGALSPVSSAYGSPARPSSPYNSSSQGSQRSSRPSSPYAAPPSPGNYAAVRTRGPYAVQSNLVQTHYHSQSMAYHQGSPQQAATVPQHTSYHPPKAMACEPLRSPSAANTSNKNTPQNRYRPHYGNQCGTPSPYDHSLDQSRFYSDHNSGNNSYYGDDATANSSYYSDQHFQDSFYGDQSPSNQRRYESRTSASIGNNNQNLSLSFDASRSVGNAFSQEMLAWFDEQDQRKPSTLV